MASELADEPGAGPDGGAGKGGSGGGKADAGRDGAGGSSGAAGSGQAGAGPGTGLGGLQACQTCVQDSCSGPGTCLGDPSCVMGITCALTQCLGGLGGLGAAGGGMGGFPGGGGLLGGGAAGGADAGGTAGTLQCVTQCFNGNMQAIFSVLQSLMCVQSQCATDCQSLLGGLGGLPGGGGGLPGGGGFPGGGTGTGGFPGGGTGFAGGAFPGGMMGGTGGGMTGTGQPASQQCRDCVQMSCASEEMSCQGAMGCSAIVQCAQDNGCNGMACLQPCGMVIFQNQGGVQAATAVGQCAQMQCAGSGC